MTREDFAFYEDFGPANRAPALVRFQASEEALKAVRERDSHQITPDGGSTSTRVLTWWISRISGPWTP